MNHHRRPWGIGELIALAREVEAGEPWGEIAYRHCRTAGACRSAAHLHKIYEPAPTPALSERARWARIEREKDHKRGLAAYHRRLVAEIQKEQEG